MALKVVLQKKLVDVNLMDKIGDEFYSLFKNKNIDKVITIEASGIAPAYATAIKLNVPLVILKKSQSNILNNNLYTTVVHSFTKNIATNKIKIIKNVSSPKNNLSPRSISKDTREIPKNKDNNESEANCLVVREFKFFFQNANNYLIDSQRSS